MLKHQRIVVAVFTLVMFAGAFANVACETKGSNPAMTANCGDEYWENMQRLVPQHYTVTEKFIDPDFKGVLFHGSDTVGLDIDREENIVIFTYMLDGTDVTETWRIEDPVPRP